MARHSRLGRPAPRTSVWAGFDLTVQVIAANASVLLFTWNAAALALRPFTIVRTHLLIGWSSDQTAASETPAGVIGGMVVSDKAAAAGIASVPSPITEASEDWFFYQPVMHDFVFISGVGTNSDGNNQYMVDSKAMRKVGIAEDLAIVVQETGVFGATVSIIGRMLLKLH